MKIAISGTQNIGKTTFINDFIKQWPKYKLSNKKNYREDIRKHGLSINQEGNEESQQIILDSLVRELKDCKRDYVIFDRCVLDNLVYTMWLNSKGHVSDEFVTKTIETVKAALVDLDIIFFLPITSQTPIALEAAEQRDIDPLYREEIDVLFKALMFAYQANSQVYFPFDHELGSPPVIEIFGNPEERIQLAKFYINDDGDSYDDGDSLIDLENLSIDDIDIDSLDEDGKLLAQELLEN